MNVDELQKINSLARELLNHKIAANNEEATQKAREMIMGKNAAQATIAESAVQKVQPEETRDHGEDINQLKNTLAYMNNDFKTLASEFQNLSKKYETLRQELIEVKRAQSHSVQQSQQTQASQPQQSQGTTARPRTGDLTPEDVAIDKVFYFGQK